MRTSALIESELPRGMSIIAASFEAITPLAVSKRNVGAWCVKMTDLESFGLIKWTPAPLSRAKLLMAGQDIKTGKGKQVLSLG